MQGTKQVRVLAPEVFDTLELTALAFGGIGRGEWFARKTDTEPGDDQNCPVCAHGIALFAEDVKVPQGSTYSDRQTQSAISRALSDAGIGIFTNDDAVSRINDRLGRDGNARVTFEQWATQLNVVRGDVEGKSGWEER